MFSQNNQTNTTVMECAQFLLPTAMGVNAPSDDLSEDMEGLHDLAAVSSKEQYALASMRLQGYSIAETACIQGMSEKRVRGLLRELYRVYLCLYA